MHGSRLTLRGVLVAGHGRVRAADVALGVLLHRRDDDAIRARALAFIDGQRTDGSTAAARPRASSPSPRAASPTLRGARAMASSRSFSFFLLCFYKTIV